MVRRTTRTRARLQDRRRAFSIIYVGLCLIPLIAFASLGIDMGRVRLARAQLQAAADAGALAGVSGLPASSTSAQGRAYDVVTQNTCIKTTIPFYQQDDVQFLIWDPVSHSPVAGKDPIVDDPKTTFDERRGANAVRVFARANTTRNNPVKLPVATVLGMTKMDIEATAVAMVTGGTRPFGFIGLDWVRMTGTTSTDSYNGATETYPGNDGTPNDGGTIASNGDITLTGNVAVNGDARPGMGGALDVTSDNVTITGWTAPLDEPLDYPVPNAPPGVTAGNNDNLQITPPLTAKRELTLGNSAYTIAQSGNYYVNNIGVGSSGALTIPAGVDVTLVVSGTGVPKGQPAVKIQGALNILGTLKLYVDGDVDLYGATQTTGGTPGNFEIFVTKAGTMVDLGPAVSEAHVYAPGSEVKVHGNDDFYGWIVGQTLNVVGNSTLHYDESNGINEPYRYRLVK